MSCYRLKCILCHAIYQISLELDVVLISEVVVVGYGTQQKREITGNIASIKGSDISNLAVQSFDQAIQGRAPGVNVNLPNGVLNNPPVFRVRGINSISLSSYPLIVIDGVPTYSGDLSTTNSANNPLSNLNPADIESIEILKDASAAAIYGSRAAAGVVLITTKRGVAGRTKVAYDGWMSWTSPARLPELLNAEQYIAYKNLAIANSNEVNGTSTPPQFHPGASTDWYDYIYRTGVSHNHSVNFSGGTDHTTYFLSLGYSQQEGMIIANDFERKSLRLNLDHRVGRLLTLGTTAAYSSNINRAPNTGSLPGQTFSTAGLGRIPLVTAPNVSPYNEDGSYNLHPAGLIGFGNNLGQSGFYNPVPIIELNRGNSDANQLQASVYGNVNITKGLTFRTQYGIDNIDVYDETFWSPVHGDGYGTNNGLAANVDRKSTRWNWTNTLQYDLLLADAHSFSFLVGNEQQYTKTDRWGAQRTQIADPFFTTYQGNFTTINPSSNFQGENYFLSYFGRVNYSFNKLLLATFNLRQDEFSAFATDNKKGVFWGGSLGFTLSELDFWKNSIGSAVNFLRLRGSYGQVGNNQGIGDFEALSTYGSGLYGPNATLTFNQAGNPDLTWETSKKTDIGINFGLFDDRITGELTYFINDIDGLILNAPQSPSKGIPGNSIATNIGRMRNNGIEIGLNGTLIRTSRFSWTSNFNIAFMENKVLELADNNADIFVATQLETANIIRVGESIGSIIAVETPGVDPATGARIFINANGQQVTYVHPGRYRYLADGGVAPSVSAISDGKIYGPTIPKWFGAWENTFRFQQLDFTVQLNYAGGNYIYNGTQAGLRDQRFWNNHTDVLNHWKQPGDVTNIPRPIFGDNISNGSGFPISENVEKGDFLRVRNVTLGYTIPSNDLFRKANISNFRVYVSANNALLLTGYSGTDPEVSTNANANGAPGVDRNSVPMARTFLIGLNLGF